jgi:hypothetical protein
MLDPMVDQNRHTALREAEVSFPCAEAAIGLLLGPGVAGAVTGGVLASQKKLSFSSGDCGFTSRSCYSLHQRSVERRKSSQIFVRSRYHF